MDPQHNLYQGHITSYDYDCPISEAGDYCQPGIGGDCKYTVSERQCWWRRWGGGGGQDKWEGLSASSS